MIKIAFVTWNMNKEESELLDKIHLYFRGLLEGKTLEIRIDDLKTLGETSYDYPCMVFGKQAINYITSSSINNWTLPSLKSMLPEDKFHKQNKLIAFDTLKEVASFLLDSSETTKDEEPTQAYVETKERLTVGAGGFDFNMTEDEANHIKKIRDILGGGKMIITKGDLRIEVEQ